ncbi:MAG TPA: LEA type 2 family protein [Phycisphaerae bacterium]|nr:LEA type 2 family protein [Phycisphaerae bacterium]
MFHRIAAAGVLAGALWSCSGCASARPVLKSVTPRILDVDLKGVDLAFDLAVENRLPLPLKSTGGKYGLDIAGSPFLNWDKVPAMNLPAGKVGTLTLPARVEYANLVKMFKTMANAREVPYRLHGALLFPMTGERFDLPFAHEGTMPGPAEAIRKGARGLLD